MNELQIFNNATNKTPIEIALQVDEDGTVSAKKVYEFLGLYPDNYSHWYKRNILENQFAEENVDYATSVAKDGSNGRMIYEFKLTVPFAKKLCMIQRSDRGEEARNYFIKVEEALKTIAQNQNIPQLTDKEMILQIAQNAVESERRMNAEISAVKEQQNILKSQLDTAVKIFSISDKSWKENMEIAIKDLMDAQGFPTNSYSYRRKLYNELDAMAGVDLQQRLSRRQNRMKERGATGKECEAVKKLDIISYDPKLRPIFESIIRKYQALHAIQPNTEKEEF